MKSPTGRFNSGNSLGCHFQHFGARELSLIHISEPTRLLSISYAVFCLKKKSEKEVTVNKKRKMKSPTCRFNSGNSLGCHFQHFGARERESKAQSSMQPRLPPRLHTALCLTLSLSLAPQC